MGREGTSSLLSAKSHTFAKIHNFTALPAQETLVDCSVLFCFGLYGISVEYHESDPLMNLNVLMHFIFNFTPHNIEAKH